MLFVGMNKVVLHLFTSAYVDEMSPDSQVVS